VPVSFSWALQPHADAPAEGRSFLSAILDQHLGSAAGRMTGDLLLVASEFVANAVRAGAKHIELTLTIESNDVRIEVLDDAAGTPTRRTALPLDTTGRGLQLVDAVAARWGVEAVSGGRKQVWAVLRLPAQAVHL
jgi:anti-sigma regulatory factor (Ser/Thr protein kinase)